MTCTIRYARHTNTRNHRAAFRHAADTRGVLPLFVKAKFQAMASFYDLDMLLTTNVITIMDDNDDNNDDTYRYPYDRCNMQYPLVCAPLLRLCNVRDIAQHEFQLYPVHANIPYDSSTKDNTNTSIITHLCNDSIAYYRTTIASILHTIDKRTWDFAYVTAYNAMRIYAYM
ncbi:hypothetical protein LSAT2_006666 [Lamellibrachia satsuma]|nr:hypothetical protein LSAT2_006666 [Lamellibrachia satsuma]